VIDTLDASDVPWIGKIIDVVEQAVGLPWRAALDEIELAPVAAHRLSAVTVALRRAGGSRSRHAAIARQARGLALGAPVFDAGERRARLAAAAVCLGIAAHELDAALWADLPGERAIELPDGRPQELAIAAAANVQLVQRALRRAQAVRVRMWPTGGEANADGSLLRAALSRGLLVTASRGPDRETVLDIVGPLALFHRTSVYARVLGQLVPLLASCDRFELVLECETGSAAYRAKLASPVLLPLVPVARASHLAEKLERDLARLAPDLQIDIAHPVLAGTQLLCPDLVIDGRWYVELVGFWTREHLVRKLERYREAGITDVILCIDETRACADDDLPAGVVGFTRRVSAARVLELVSPRSCRSRDA
jgi:predicted nuclease of restriction endonuclease-like RecB superfamily